jgi:hypothetical protein
MSNTIKTTQAKRLPLRVPIAWAGTEAKPLPATLATAYKRTDGVLTIAIRGVGVTEVKKNDRVRWSEDPAGIGAKNLRWCRTCDEAHLMRIGTDKALTVYCDVREAELRAGYKANPRDLSNLSAEQRRSRRPDPAAAAAAKADAINQRIGRAADRPEPSRDRVRAASIRNMMWLYGEDHARVEAQCKVLGLTLAKGVALVKREYGVDWAPRGFVSKQGDGLRAEKRAATRATKAAEREAAEAAEAAAKAKADRDAEAAAAEGEVA